MCTKESAYPRIESRLAFVEGPVSGPENQCQFGVRKRLGSLADDPWRKVGIVLATEDEGV